MMHLYITRGGEETKIHAMYKSLSVSKEIGIRGESLTFTTNTPVKEWDIVNLKEDVLYNVEYGGEAITYNGQPLTYLAEESYFSGIVDSVEISNIMGDAVEYRVSSNGWKKLLDRAIVAKRYTNRSSGNIVRDIISEYIPDFLEGNIEEGIFVESFPINNIPPSEIIDMLAEANGFTWRIDSKKKIYFEKQTRNSASRELTLSENFYKDLSFSPDVTEIVNTVIVRGGFFLSPTVTFEEKGDGEKRQFVLPEKPKNVSVFVNGAEKTIAPKFGETTPTAEFLINYGEKYIENGTYSTLTASDTITVSYQYDIPLRYKYQDLVSVGEMQTLFPSTNGEFVKLIEDNNIEDRAVAEERAKAEIEAKGNPIIEGSFKTMLRFFAGDVATINMLGYNREVVITKITAKSIGGGVLEYTVNFATVLFKFEDFLRSLLKKNKLSFNDNEVVENIQAFPEKLQLQETFLVNDEGNIKRETIFLSELFFAEKIDPNFTFVYGNYMPTSHIDTTRNGLYSIAQYE